MVCAVSLLVSPDRQLEAAMKKTHSESTKVLARKKLRSLAVNNAVASSLLENVKPSARTMADLKRYADGKVSIDTLIADARSRYARAG